MLHYGHIRLLERAKALGDYLIVGVTADDFDRARGKINVRQSLMERMEAVRQTGLADEIIVEEYAGQKIDDIQRYGVDIFTVGSDWKGKFDYLNEYCRVVYLDRTQGVSSSEIRSKERHLRLGLVGNSRFLEKFYRETKYVNGLSVEGLCTSRKEMFSESLTSLPVVTSEFAELVDAVDALYLISSPFRHYEQIKLALEHGKHVLCEAPLTITPEQHDELHRLAREHGVVLLDAIRVAYSMAYARMLLLLKSGIIGEVKSVDATCTSLRPMADRADDAWNSICSWGPTAMLPVFQILGIDYVQKTIASNFADDGKKYDNFSKVSFVYPHAVASIKVGRGVKSEGELIVSGTEGYIYVPAPWWKMDYFETRFEDANNNKRYFYQLDGEGIRYELVHFLRVIEGGRALNPIPDAVSQAITQVINDFYQHKDLIEI